MRLQKRRQGLRFWVGVATGLVISMIGLLTWWFVPPPRLTEASASPDGAAADAQPAVHVLLMGVDERPGVIGGRSDTMLLARFAAGQVRLLSIPRDTLVHLEGHEEGKINGAYAYGGVDLAREAVSQVTGVPVDYYVKVDLAAFREAVDLLGGVWYDVPKPMYYEDPTDGLSIALDPGMQLLDGEQAEQFVRFRHDEIGDDMGRIHRQQEFLKAAARQAFTPANLTKLPRLISAVRADVETDVPLTMQLRLAQVAFSAQQRGTLLQETLPGKADYLDGISFFFVDEEQLDQLQEAWK